MRQGTLTDRFILRGRLSKLQKYMVQLFVGYELKSQSDLKLLRIGNSQIIPEYYHFCFYFPAGALALGSYISEGAGQSVAEEI